MTTTEKAAEVVLVPVDEPDPLWDMKYTGRRMSKSSRELFFQGAEADEWQQCGERVSREDNPDDLVGMRGEWRCARPPHPDHWRHIATGGYRGDIQMYAMWGGVAPAELAVEELVADPDPEPFTLEVGKFYKFRNRPTVLMYLGKRRGKRAEVLDLTHQRYRVLTEEQLVPRPAHAEPLTTDQLKWVATYMAERRDKTRETAIQQRRERRFNTRQELDNVLVELGLEPTVQLVVGTAGATFNISGGSDTAEVKRVFKEWIEGLSLPPGLRFTDRTSFSFNLSHQEG